MSPQPWPAPIGEIVRGAVVGGTALVAFAAGAGATDGLVAAAALVGMAAGAVTGLMVWLETAELPDGVIPPPYHFDTPAHGPDAPGARGRARAAAAPRRRTTVT